MRRKTIFKNISHYHLTSELIARKRGDFESVGFVFIVERLHLFIIDFCTTSFGSDIDDKHDFVAGRMPSCILVKSYWRRA